MSLLFEWSRSRSEKPHCVSKRHESTTWPEGFNVPEVFRPLTIFSWCLNFSIICRCRWPFPAALISRFKTMCQTTKHGTNTASSEGNDLWIMSAKS
jgi:hypothetical protein